MISVAVGGLRLRQRIAVCSVAAQATSSGVPRSRPSVVLYLAARASPVAAQRKAPPKRGLVIRGQHRCEGHQAAGNSSLGQAIRAASLRLITNLYAVRKERGLRKQRTQTASAGGGGATSATGAGGSTSGGGCWSPAELHGAGVSSSRKIGRTKIPMSAPTQPAQESRLRR
jgi:hypothetical protein